MKETVVLFMCGSFNPVTNMHLRMMEIARDHLHHCGHTVKGGFVSPVHDSYPKDTLISIKHRAAMLKLTLESSDWLHLSTWESEQKSWTETYQVLQHHQEKIHELMKTKNINRFENKGNKTGEEHNVTVKLVCGADFLASFLIPNLWKPEHVELILKKYGIVVITRTGYNVADIIEKDDILYKYMSRIIVVNEYIENAISSTKIRRACHRNRSIKYLVPDKVEQYIKTHGLYTISNNDNPSPEKNSSRSSDVITNLSTNSISSQEKVPSSKKKSANNVPRRKVKISKNIANKSKRPKTNYKRKSN